MIVFRFRNSNKAVICLSFKGTSPFELTEWLTDASMSKTEGSDFLWGAIHEGLYSKLFLTAVGELNAYEHILENIKNIMESQQGNPNLEYSLFHTGHSLGGGLAALFYARLLKSPDDLRDLVPNAKINFVGGYTFGAPKVGNFDFANQVSSSVKVSITRTSPVLYRVQNACDFAPTVPYGRGDGQIAFITCNNNPQDLFDYSNIGTLVALHHYESLGEPKSRILQPDFLGMPQERQVDTYLSLLAWLLDICLITTILSNVIDTVMSWAGMFNYKDVVSFFCAVVPIVGDHLPARYYLDIANLKTVKDQSSVGQ